jgi:hypothetical protein
MKILLRSAVILALVGVTACQGNVVSDNGSTPGTSSEDGGAPGTSSGNEVAGQLAGNTFSAQDAISVQTALSDGDDFVGSSTYVMITDTSGTCADPTQSIQLMFALASLDENGGATPASTPGTYMVVSGNPEAAGDYAEAFYAIDTETQSAGSFAEEGSIVLTAPAQPGGVSGTFDVTFGDGSHVTGSFDASNCAQWVPNWGM